MVELSVSSTMLLDIIALRRLNGVLLVGQGEVYFPCFHYTKA